MHLLIFMLLFPFLSFTEEQRMFFLSDEYFSDSYDQVVLNDHIYVHSLNCECNHQTFIQNSQPVEYNCKLFFTFEGKLIVIIDNFVYEIKNYCICDAYNVNF